MCLPSLLVDGCSFLRCHTDLLIGPLWNSYMLGLSSWLNKDVIQLLVLPCIASLPIGWNCRVKSVTYVVVVARVPNLGQMVWEWVSILCSFFSLLINIGEKDVCFLKINSSWSVVWCVHVREGLLADKWVLRGLSV